MNVHDVTEKGHSSYEVKVKKLIQIADEHKKGNSRERDEFERAWIDAWIGLVKEQGLDEVTVKYLLDGLAIAKAEPFKAYADSCGDKSLYEELKRILERKRDGSDKPLQIMLNLFALEITSPSSADGAQILAKALPQINAHRKGRSNTISQANVEKYVLAPLSGGIDKTVKLESSSANNVLVLLKETLAQSRRKASESKLKKINCLEDWLKEQAGLNTEDAELGHEVDHKLVLAEPENSDAAVEDTNSDEHVEDEVGATEPERDTTEEDHAISGSDKVVVSSEVADTLPDAEERQSGNKPTLGKTQGKEENKPVDINVDTVMTLIEQNRTRLKSAEVDGKRVRVSEILKFLEGYRKEHVTLLDTKKRLSDERHAALLHASMIEQQLRDMVEKAQSFRDSRDAISQNYAVLYERVNALEEENESLRSDVIQAQELIRALEARETNTSDGKKEALARKLRYNYRNYLDAKDEDMSIELGEIMRHDLREVFDMIRDFGIEI